MKSCVIQKAGQLLPSRPGEFHPEPLTDPDVNLSIHTAYRLLPLLVDPIQWR
jgi:hypothetical protein